MLSITSFVFFAAVALGVTWFSLDMRSITRSAQRRNWLEIEGRWNELEEFLDRLSRPRRPFVWLHQRFFLPGTVAVQYALFLFKRGRLEEALLQADLAIRQVNGKPRAFESLFQPATIAAQRGALRTKILILTGMGRYDEARQVGGQLRLSVGPTGRPGPVLALLEYYCGNLDQAVTLAEATPPRDGQYDVACTVLALVYSMKGEFERAIQVLDFEPGEIAKFYTPADLEIMRQSTEGAKLVELQGKKLSAVYQPSRLLSLSSVYIAQEDFNNAGRVLDQAEAVLGREPAIELTYYRHRTICRAGQGNCVETEKCIERLRKLAQDLPKRSFLWEVHYAAGISCTYLKQFDKALAELTKAQQYALHPVERHSTTYWIARACDSAGDWQKALPCYQAVAADSIPSWMRMRAAEILARM